MIGRMKRRRLRLTALTWMRVMYAIGSVATDWRLSRIRDWADSRYFKWAGVVARETDRRIEDVI